MSYFSYLKNGLCYFLIGIAGIQAQPLQTIKNDTDKLFLKDIIAIDDRYTIYRPHTSVVESSEINELKISSLLERYDRSTTRMGSFGLDLMGTPTGDVTLLKKRQQILQELINHDESYNRISSYLHDVVTSQDSILHYWDTHYYCHKYAHDNFYFNLFKGLNSSAIALESSTAFGLAYTTRQFFYYAMLSGLWDEFNYWLISANKEFSLQRGLTKNMTDVVNDIWMWRKKYAPEATDYKHLQAEAKQGFINGYHLANAFHLGTFADRAYAGSWFGISQLRMMCVDFPKKAINYLAHKGGLKNIFDVKQRPLSNNIFLFTWLGIVPAAIYSTYRFGEMHKGIVQSYNQIKQHLTCIEQLRINLRNIGMLIQKTEKIYEWLKTHPTLQHLDATKTLSHYYEPTLMKPGFKAIYNSTTSYLVTINSSIVYSRGKVLLAHKAVENNKDLLIPLLIAIAELDAYCSITSLYKEYETQEIRFSLPTYIEQSTPSISIDNGWYPLMPTTTTVVANDIMTGNQAPRALIFTGPNACGKSLCIKMVGLIAYLAQSWGIVPAKQVSITPFETIATCFISEEDASAGLSTFAAEQVRMARIGNKMMNGNTGSNHKVLAIVDEPYRGTVHNITAESINLFFDTYVVPADNSILLIATHVESPVHYADTYPSLFANYHMTIDFENHDHIKRTFKISPGPATWWFHDDNKQHRFIQWFRKEFSRV